MKSPKITKREVGIIKRAQAGDMSAFNKLFRRYKRFVEKVLYSYLKDWDESKDLTNVVFLKVYKKLSTFSTYDSFGGWLRIIANRTAIDYLRKIRIVSVPLDDDDDRLPPDQISESLEVDIVNQLTYDELMKAFEDLPSTARKICMLFYMDNFKVDQISKLLSIPTGTIKSTLSRTRRKLKKQLNL